MKEIRFDRLHDLYTVATERFVSSALESVSTRGWFAVSICGGQSPLPLFDRLALEHAREAFWSRTDVFWTDERHVAHESPESNFRVANERLLAKVMPACVHAIPTNSSPEADASRYEATLKQQ